MIETASPHEFFPKLEPLRTPEGEIDHTFYPFSRTGTHLGWIPLLSGLGYSARAGDQLLVSGSGPGDEPMGIWKTVPGDIRKSVEIIVAEPNGKELATAQKNLAGLDGNFRFLQEDAIQVLNNGLHPNWIFFNAAIHLLPQTDRPVVVRKMWQSLPDEGKAVIVSTFIEEWRRSDEKRLYDLWTLRTRRILEKQHPELLRIISNVKDRSGSVVVEQMWSVEQYRKTFEENGFKLLFFEYDTDEVVMRVPFEGFFYIAQYEEWIRGSHPVKAVDEKISEEEYQKRMDIVTLAQQEALYEVFPTRKKPGETSPRNQMVAVLQKAA